MTSGDELAAKFVCPFEGCTMVLQKKSREIKKHKRSHIQKGLKREHKCNICDAVFSRPWRLERHLRSHTGERPFVCDLEGCSKSYTNLCHLKRHKLVSHEKAIKYQEFMCGEVNCGKVFETKFGLKRHVLRNHSSESRPFRCPKCHMRFKKRIKLQAHMGIHGESKIEEYKCDKCGLIFSNQIDFTKHLKNHKTYTCDCLKIFDRWSEICRHRRDSCTEKQEHKCVICDKTFSSKPNLSTHTLTHVEESKLEVFQCPYLGCTRSYKYRKNLTFHIGFIHEKKINTDEENENNKLKVFRCPYSECARRYMHERSLGRHINFLHKKKKKTDFKEKRLLTYECSEEECGMSFTSKKKLNKHRRALHLGLPEKKRKSRKERKDKGQKKDPTKDWAADIAGMSNIEIRSTTEDLPTNNNWEGVSTESGIKIISDITLKGPKSDYKSGWKINFKKRFKDLDSKRMIAPIGFGVTSRRKKKRKNNESIDTSAEKKANMRESDIESDAPSEILLSHADKTLDRLESILNSEQENIASEENYSETQDDFNNSNQKNNLKLKVVLTQMDKDQELLHQGKDKEDYGTSSSDSLSSSSDNNYSETQNTFTSNSQINNTFKLRSLKVVLTRMDMGLKDLENISEDKDKCASAKGSKTLDKIKDVLKNLSADDSKVEAALKKIEKLLEGKVNMTDQMANRNENFSVPPGSSGGSNYQLFTNPCASTDLQKINLDGVVSTPNFVQNVVTYENSEFLSLVENVIILPFEGDVM